MSASANNNNPSQSSPFGHSTPPNPSAHLQSQTQSQTQQLTNSPFTNQFQLSQFAATHVQPIAQAQTKAQAKAAAQAQANHAQFQAQLQAQGLAPNQSHGSNLAANSPSFTSGIASTKRTPQKQIGRPPGVSNPNALSPMSQKQIGRPPGVSNSNAISPMIQKQVGRPPGVSNANAISPMRAMELAPAPRSKKKQKLSGKQLQERVAVILPQSALYTQLLEFESRVDAALVRKKIDIQEAIKNPPCIQKTLRIYVFNTFSNQVDTIPKKKKTEPPSWTMKIIGRILEEGMDADEAGLISKPNPIYPKFSSFFKRVTISLDQRLYPDNHTIVWDSSKTPTPHEGFEVKRKGDKEFMVNIRLEMNYLPENFMLSDPLMEILGIEVDTRSRIIAALWQYVKARKLQDADNPSYFNCDTPLQKIFGEEKMKFSMVSQMTLTHLSPPQPIHLEHKIKLSGNSPAGNACYDVVVDIPFPAQKELSVLLAKTEKNKEIEACNEAICTTIRKINEHRKRRAFFLGFSQSPVEFIDALIESQSKDLKFLAGEVSRSDEKEHRADFYNQPWVEDAVIRYLNRKPASKPMEAPN